MPQTLPLSGKCQKPYIIPCMARPTTRNITYCGMSLPMHAVQIDPPASCIHLTEVPRFTSCNMEKAVIWKMRSCSRHGRNELDR